MKSTAYFIAILYLLLFVSGSLFGFQEQTLRFSGEALWGMAEHRSGISPVNQVRPNPVLALSSAGTQASSLDLSVSFDQGDPSHYRDYTGNYRLVTSPALQAVDRRFARAGYGAILFPGASPFGLVGSSTLNSREGGPMVIEAQNRAALFSPNNRMSDFTLEFWLQPLNMENGEEILQWSSTRPAADSHSGFSFQRILAVASRNRLQWSFDNIFSSPDGRSSIDLSLTGVSAIVPRTWSHHLIRFDSNTGLLEYMVDGRSEAIVYATSTRREGGEIFTPVTGEGGSFVLGGNYLGMMDEFRIHRTYVPNATVQRYAERSGRIETQVIDLGAGINQVVRLDASGGRTSIRETRISSEYRQSGHFRFSDDSQMEFFMRVSDNPYRWDNPWRAVTPGDSINGGIIGRYVQLAVSFYPSYNGEASPYLEEIRISYIPDEAPLPPAQLTAVAMDGAVQLQWRNSPNLNTQGYLIYYGTSSDDYFGEDAAQGASPIDVGRQNAVRIEGLRNGVLYFFRVAAYSNAHIGSPHIGEFSREVRARPLQSP